MSEIADFTKKRKIRSYVPPSWPGNENVSSTKLRKPQSE